MKVYLTALGCRLNEAELQTWSNDFSQLGIAVTRERDEANLMVINTCAVTGEAARKSRQAIRRLHRKNPTAKLVVTGCYASLEQQQAEKLLGVDLIISNADKNLLAEKSRDLLDWPSMPFAATEPNETPLFVRNRERAFIKVQDGCRYRCTYCIVTLARGEETSRKTEDIINEINRIQSQGIQEIVITGVHVGGYGSDINSSLYRLIKQILKDTDIARIRFASVEPWDLDDHFFELFRNPRVMPHMHLPMQSGSDRILKKMSRRCKVEDFLKLVGKARSVVPDFNITSDIIVGFPFETDADFEASIDLVRRAKFGHTHIFAYSKREGTKAATLEQQIDDATKKHRSKQLHKVAAECKRKALLNLLDQSVDVLWEGKGKVINKDSREFYGYTSSYHKVTTQIAINSCLTNQLTRCKIIRFNADGSLQAKIEDSDVVANNKIAIFNL